LCGGDAGGGGFLKPGERRQFIALHALSLAKEEPIPSLRPGMALLGRRADQGRRLFLVDRNPVPPVKPLTEFET
jgi:hypothetical protein